MAHATSIVTDEAGHFGRLAADWWDPKGSSAMLHRINPVRLRYIRERIDAHWGGDPAARSPLAGKRALDMGCGAGLATEPLARMGAVAVGIDAAPENIEVARLHAAQTGLVIDYRAGDADAVAGEQFDLIVSLEVIEHVADPGAFTASLAALLAPGGLMIFSTPNRTVASRLALLTVGEGLGLIPRGTHDWNKFLKPDELAGHVEAAGLGVRELRGFAYDPLRGARMTDSLAQDYFLVAACAP